MPKTNPTDGPTAGPSRVSGGGCDTGCCLACVNDVATLVARSSASQAGSVLPSESQSELTEAFEELELVLLPEPVGTSHGHHHQQKKCFIHGWQQPKQLSRETGRATRSLGAGTEGELRGNCKFPTVGWGKMHASLALLQGKYCRSTVAHPKRRSMRMFLHRGESCCRCLIGHPFALP